MNNRPLRRSALVAYGLLFMVVSVPVFAKPPSRQVASTLSLQMTMEGYFRVGFVGWILTVDAHSRARVTLDDGTTHRFQVSAAQIAHLREVLYREHFFELGEKYGSQVTDGSTRTLTVQQGKRKKSVILYTLAENGSSLSEVKRALRVWNEVRYWFHDEKAVNSVVYDQRILNRLPE